MPFEIEWDFESISLDCDTPHYSDRKVLGAYIQFIIEVDLT